jgi:mannose-1-phosphate guanylyltransferase
MAGGVGERFWPVSRAASPKQFLDILGTGKSLLQMTVNRLQKICSPDNMYVVTSEKYYDLTKEQIPQLSDEQIILEPMRRNTAPCIAYANLKIKQRNPHANIIVAPADHIIIHEDSFVSHLQAALDCTAKNPWLLTLGIKPTRPDTGYGYIQYDDRERYVPDPRISKVKLFAEKPELELAQQFLESGDFLWNAGIFVWQLPVIEHAFELYLPEIANLFAEGTSALNTEREKTAMRKIYEICPAISIDYGIMEKAHNTHVLASDFDWSDLGTWRSLFDFLPKDANGNVVQNNREVFVYDTTGCIINTPAHKVVVLQGLDDYIIVENDNILLICQKSKEQKIRQFVGDISLAKGDKFI